MQCNIFQVSEQRENRQCFFFLLDLLRSIMTLIVVCSTCCGENDGGSDMIFFRNRWAVSTVMTRQNLVPSVETSRSDDGQQLPVTVNALVPLWDFCNHQDGTVC